MPATGVDALLPEERLYCASFLTGVQLVQAFVVICRPCLCSSPPPGLMSPTDSPSRQDTTPTGTSAISYILPPPRPLFPSDSRLPSEVLVVLCLRFFIFGIFGYILGFWMQHLLPYTPLSLSFMCLLFCLSFHLDISPSPGLASPRDSPSRQDTSP
ncbi:hypothetical protein C8R44DRAFT_308084 [Mycena epipterygia]|nr:hypothetical protein C8R44DRAFT_308084 [Mycena epipterygia]